MNSTAIEAVLSVIEEAVALIPNASGAGKLIANIVTMLEEWLPIIVSEYKSLAPIVKNIIASLQSNGEITDEQKATLSQLDAQADAAFEDSFKGIDPDAGDA